jgi:hypothetical protein
LTWTVFDALTVNFRHTKTQQHGEAKRQKRACYSNPFEYYIDLPFLLGLRFSCGFTFKQSRGYKLFPGSAKSQATRAGRILQMVLKEHEAEVLAMGYDKTSNLGLHSIRKGVATHIASLPGGPPPAATCLRGGWSMGQVKDIYFHQTQGGDEFVGRCVALLNMMNGDFAVSPAFFEDDVDSVSLENARNDVFPQFRSIAGMDRVLKMCLASLVHHRAEVDAFAPDHIARRNISMFCNPAGNGTEEVKVVRAWETREIQLTGVPPHVKELVDLDALRRESCLTVADKVYEKVIGGLKEYLESRGIGGGELTEARIKDMISSATGEYFERLEKKLDNMARLPGTIKCNDEDGEQEVKTYELQMNGLGQLTRIPADFEFPTSNTYNCWVQWNVGNKAQSIPPLRLTDPPAPSRLN